MITIWRAAIIGATILLAACSSEKEDTPRVRVMLDFVKNIRTQTDNTAELRAVIESLTREQIIGAGKDPLILIDLEENGQYASLNQVSKNREYGIFRSSDRKTLTFVDGLLVATRGLGDDMMASDLSDTRMLLESGISGANKSIRTHKWLGGESQVITVTYICQLEDFGIRSITSIHKQFRLRKYTETCKEGTDGGVEFTNTYWQHPKTGVIWKSRQWAGPVTGYIGIEVLIPQI